MSLDRECAIGAIRAVGAIGANVKRLENCLKILLSENSQWHELGFGIRLISTSRRIDMQKERKVRLFRNDRNQAIRIPRAFEFDAKEVVIRRENNRLILEPVPQKGLLALLARLEPIPEDFPDVDAGLSALDDDLITAHKNPDL